MKNFRLFIMVVLVCLLSAPTYAQHEENRREQSVQAFYYSPSKPLGIAIVDFITLTPDRHYLEPSAPRFLLTDSKHKFALGIGGVVRGTTSLDFDGIIPSMYNNGFETALIPSTRGDLPRSQAIMSAATSEIFVKMVGNTGRLGYFSVYVSMNFMGKDHTPQLRNAYVDFLGFRVGQTWSTLTDLSAIPPTIDYAGPISYAGYHVPQIRYTRLFAEERFQFAVAAEYPTVNAVYSEMEVAQPQGVPNFVGYLQANFRNGGHLRVSGLYRGMNYKDLYNYKTEREDGWGVQLSGMGKISSPLTLYYQGIYGEGIAKYMNDLSNTPYDMMPNLNKMGMMMTPEMWGAYGGIKWDISDEVYTSFTYSYSRLYSEKEYEIEGMYKFAQYYVGNLFWDVSEELCVGLEYLRGNIRRHSGEWGKANRINLMVQYNF